MRLDIDKNAVCSIKYCDNILKKWQVTSTADEDEDEISDLRQRMAAYNFNSSPDRSEGK